MDCVFVRVCVCISSKIEEFDASKALENEDHSEILLNEESRDRGWPQSSIHNKDT